MSDFKLLEELENSSNILERQEYANRLLTYIQKLEKDIQEMIKLEVSQEHIKKNKDCLKTWKIKLSNYDIYKQDISSQCDICKEMSCICDELTRGNKQVQGELQSSDGKERSERSQTLEQLPGRVGDNLGNPQREITF